MSTPETDYKQGQCLTVGELRRFIADISDDTLLRVIDPYEAFREFAFVKHETLYLRVHDDPEVGEFWADNPEDLNKLALDHGGYSEIKRVSVLNIDFVE